MANRLITDIPSDIVSDGLQLWTDDIPMFGELLPSVKLLVRLPDSTKDKQYEIKYSMVSDEENHTIIFEGSISELKVSSKLEFDWIRAAHSWLKSRVRRPKQSAYIEICM